MNEPLSKAYYLKEQLRQIWMQPVKAMGESVFDDWVRQAEQSKIPQLQKMAVTMRAYKAGILAWYDCHLSTGKVEGINNKIKVMKRNAYGFRDDRYFTLRLYALHDCRITRNVGWAIFLNEAQVPEGNNTATVENIAHTAMLLFAGYIDAATSMSESCGGGGGSVPESGWGKKDDKDERAFARRCLLMAHSMYKPKTVKRGFHH